MSRLYKSKDITGNRYGRLVAMDKDGEWYWYPLVPDTGFNGEWRCNAVQSTYTLRAFDIAPADDWTKSLIKVGGK